MQNKITQFDLMMKTIMVVLFVIGLFAFFVDITKAADYWVNDPYNCPTEYVPEGVSCSGGNVICGVSGAACIDPALIVKRSVNSAGSQTLYSNSFGGGYLVNCTAIRDTDGSPYCDNNTQYWCNRDSSCYNNHIQTVCLANNWAGGGVGVSFNCATTASGTNSGCVSGYTNCNANPDCEVAIGSACVAEGGLPGTRNASCGCDLPAQNFVTGIEAKFATTSPLLWGKQFGSGDLISFSNATSSNIFVVKNDASIFMSSTLATTSEKYLYNYNGDLYWGDIKLNTGGGVYTAGSGLNLIGYEFSVNTSFNFTWAGQHTFNATTTFPLGVWSTTGRVGINTTSLLYTLNVQMMPGSYGAFGLYSVDGNLLANIGNMRGVDGEPNDTGAFALYYNTTTLTAPMVLLRANGDKSYIATGTLSIGNKDDGDDYNGRLKVFGDINIITGTLRFSNVAGTVDQIIKINSAGFPEWVSTSSLGIVGLPAGSTGQILVNNGGSNWVTSSVFRVDNNYLSVIMNGGSATGLYSAAFGGNNTSTGDYSFIAGGNHNIASGYTSFVSGNYNTASGYDAFVAGGEFNTASGYSSFIGGGVSNVASGQFASTIGGNLNTASGNYSFIVGGYNNVASATNSMALGYQMQVSGNYSFGLNVSTTPAVLNQPNTIALMGGNVGIGTTTPNVALTVDGRFRVTQTSTMRDVVPEVTETYSLGTSILRWLFGWFKNLFVQNLFADNATITSTVIFEATITSSTLTSTTISEATIANLNVQNATTTNLYTQNLTVSNTVKSRMYCDVNGNNCFDPSELGWSIPQAQTMNTTTASYNGNFGSYPVANGKVSYEAANEICSSTVGAGFHICQTNEIIDIIRLYGTSTFAGKINGWVANGPPGYVTVSTNDCEGYTTSSALSYGTWWKYNDNNGGGSGKMISCNSSMPISCCK